MAATNGNKQQTTVVDKLRTADQRWARRNSDQPAAAEYLEHLACSLTALVAPSTSDGEPSISDADVTHLRAELDQARAEIEELRQQATPTPTVEPEKVREQARLIRQLRDDYDAAASELAGVRTELSAMQTERDQLAERLGAATSHRCTWKWHGPDEPINPCSCGRPVPRYELHEVG